MKLWHWVALIPHGARTEHPRASKRFVENMGGYYDSEATLAAFVARVHHNKMREVERVLDLQMKEGKT